MAIKPNDQNIGRFLTLFGEFEQSLNGHKESPAHQIRQMAINRLKSLSFPTRRDEEYKYTSVTRLVTQDYHLNPPNDLEAAVVDAFRIPDLHAATLVFVNGQFRKDLSDVDALPDGLHLETIDDALQDEAHKSHIHDLLTSAVESGQDPFVVLNAAFAKRGYYLHVPRHTQVSRPVHFLYVNTEAEQPYLFNPQNMVVVEPGAELTLVETFNSTAPATAQYFGNLFNRMIVRENAHVHHYKIQRESLEAFQMNNTEVYQYQDSTYSNYTIDLGGRIVRNNLNAIHKGQNVTSNMYGSFYGRKNQHIDNHTFIDHAIPHCQSNELYKGILTDKARGVFNGKVLVRKDAQKTNAFQQNSSLVLSDRAVMDSKPQLEIFADDVKCSHGATIGQLEEDAVFYLRSRGLSNERAREALQYAFLLEVLEFMPNEAMRVYAEAQINDKFTEAI